MSYSGQETQNALLQISANITTCLSLWRKVKVLCEARESMSTGVIRDISDSLEATLQKGEVTAGNIPYVPPQSKLAFDHGDDISHQELRSVIDSQRNLIATLEDIRNQLTASFQTQSSPTKGPRRAPNPERVLDIDTIWSIVESVNDQLKNTSEALKSLTVRIVVRPPPIPGQDTKGPPLPGSFPSAQSYGQPQTPISVRSERSPSQNGNDGSPKLRLRPEQPPPQPPRHQEPIIVTASAPPPIPERKPSTEIRRRPADRPITPPLQNISGQPGTYCTGAIRLQRDPHLRIADIVRHSSHTPIGINANSICKHCYLELDTSLPGEVLPGEKTRTTIAMQHIMVCASLVDTKAMFRCLPCSKAEQDAEFRVVGNLWQHMNVHHMRSH